MRINFFPVPLFVVYFFWWQKLIILQAYLLKDAVISHLSMTHEGTFYCYTFLHITTHYQHLYNYFCVEKWETQEIIFVTVIPKCPFLIRTFISQLFNREEKEENEAFLFLSSFFLSNKDKWNICSDNKRNYSQLLFHPSFYVNQ